MIRSRRPGQGRARSIVLALLGVLLYQLGGYVAAPGLDGRVLGEYLRARRATGGTALIDLYDLLAGGGLSRGALLALGVMPYLSAWAFVRLARVCIPAVRAAAARDDGHATLRRWTRILTLVVALVQSFGFTRFVQAIPGVVAQPGSGFVLRTMLLLTVGAVAVMWLGERITGDHAVDDAADEAPDEAFEPAPVAPAIEPPALPPTRLDVERPVLRAPAEPERATPT